MYSGSARGRGAQRVGVAAGTHLAAKTLDRQLQLSICLWHCPNCLFPLIVVDNFTYFYRRNFAIFGQIERHLQHANWPLDKSISKRCQKQHCGCSTPSPCCLLLSSLRPCTTCTTFAFWHKTTRRQKCQRP